MTDTVRVHLSWRVRNWRLLEASFASGTTAAGASVAAAAFPVAALVEAGEEGMMEGLLQSDALVGVVVHHLLNQIEKLPVVFPL